VLNRLLLFAIKQPEIILVETGDNAVSLIGNRYRHHHKINIFANERGIGIRDVAGFRVRLSFVGRERIYVDLLEAALSKS
jgi:hypothetical protein